MSWACNKMHSLGKTLGAADRLAVDDDVQNVFQDNGRPLVRPFGGQFHILKLKPLHVPAEQSVSREPLGEHVGIRIALLVFVKLPYGVFLRPAAGKGDGHVLQGQIFDPMVLDSANDTAHVAGAGALDVLEGHLAHGSHAVRRA